MKKICIFEVDAVDVDRFFTDVINFHTPPSLIYVDEPSEYIKYIEYGKFKDEDVQCSAWMSINVISKILKSKSIEVVLIDAHRIPDIRIILAARKAGCTVSYLQHGMYIPFMKRTPSFFISNLMKTLRYMYYAIDASLTIKQINLFFDLILIHVLGYKRERIKKYPCIFPDRAATFSLYWSKWHEVHYSFPKNILFEMGTPDFKKLKFGENLANNTIAYCYQTLVEDGRIEEKIMLSFYENLLRWGKDNNKKIIVKTHPRASHRLIQWFTDRGVNIVSNHVPNTTTVIGHYSSLLAFWGIHNRRVICIKLPGHEIDQSISAWAEVFESFQLIDTKNEGKNINIEKCIHTFGFPIPHTKLLANLNLIEDTSQ